MAKLTLPILLIIGYLGYKILKQFHVPSSALLGAMLAVGITSVAGVPWDTVPSYINLFFQVLIGIMIGAKFNQDTVRLLRALILPAVIVAGWMIITGLTVGLLLAQFTTLDVKTALLSSIPGGIAEMSILALSYNLEVPKVAFFHSLRLIMVHTTIPIIAKYSKYIIRESFDKVRESKDVLNPTTPNSSPIEKTSNFLIAKSILLGIIGGYLGKKLGLPAGGMLGAMVMVGLLRINGYEIMSLPRKAVIFTQIGMGGILGLSFNEHMLIYIKDLFVPLVLVSFLQLLSGILLAFLIEKFFRWDILTSICACSVAGVSQMSIVAIELDADPIKVSLMHLVRFVSIVTAAPLILSFFV